MTEIIEVLVIIVILPFHINKQLDMLINYKRIYISKCKHRIDQLISYHIISYHVFQHEIRSNCVDLFNISFKNSQLQACILIFL